MTTNLPPELSAFAQLLDAQPEPVRQAFPYCLAPLMVEAGKARLVEARPGEAGWSWGGGEVERVKKS